MNDVILALLLVLFLAHLAGFVIVGLKRRQWYYLALVTTFALLSAAFAVRLFAPGVHLGQFPLHLLFRMAAWGAAAVSISWTLVRLIARRRA